MITRHHIALALICALIVCSSFVFKNPLLVIIFCFGTCIGAILPDIHMSRPKKFVFRTLAWLVVQLPRQLCAPVLCRISACTGYPATGPSDKRLTHSIPGILFITACAGLFLYVPAISVDRAVAGDVALFLAGLLLGMGLHLAEDLCTRKGIFPFFPFSREKIAGSIRPCDETDPRISWYHIQHGSILLLLLFLESTGIIAPALALPVSLAGLTACLGIMVYFSDVAIRKDPGPAGTVRMSFPVKSTGRL
ncbi:MAG: metal-dependent hydrolase [Methanoregula sp.]|uniref:metal-dependent hydrolase n=1 Tax=Methanoregula sp. TaxID=2052170 RepID=UPI003BAE9597